MTTYLLNPKLIHRKKNLKEGGFIEYMYNMQDKKTLEETQEETIMKDLMKRVEHHMLDKPKLKRGLNHLKKKSNIIWFKYKSDMSTWEKKFELLKLEYQKLKK